MNTVLLIGRLTKDPALSTSMSSKTSYCRFNLAVSRGRNKNGEEETDFPTIVAFGKTAENMSRYTEKGNMMAVEGEVRTGRYEKNGKTIYTEEIIANRVEFLQWKRSEKEAPPQPEASPSPSIPDGFTQMSENDDVTEDDLPF